VLVKYGEPQFMSDLYESGRLRIRPASYYVAPVLNGAVRDDEHALAISLAISRETASKLVKNPQDMPEEYAGQRMDFQLRYPGSYWLFCVSETLAPRLFVDFEKTACVIIKQPEEFIRRLRKSGAAHFPCTNARSGPATYIDPLLPRTAHINLTMSKHFRFSYQREHRFVWETRETLSPDSFVDVELGRLKDISELVLLP
jgi:hypothetical protein